MSVYDSVFPHFALYLNVHSSTLIKFWALISIVMRTQKYLQATFGGVEDDILDDADEDEQEKSVWVKKKDMYGGDDYEVRVSENDSF